jgi:SAM-dependent methyltransferase
MKDPVVWGWCCTKCSVGGEKRTLRLDEARKLLECGACGAVFPISDGIPRFVAVDGYAKSFGFQWNKHARAQLDSYTGLPISRDRLLAATQWPQDMRGMKVLEAGSGAGRFTEVLVSTGADVVSFDYSSAVDANARNNGSAPNLTLFQGDIFNIPFAGQGFDAVVCLGVLQHTPDPHAAFLSLARQVKSGGSLAIDVYRRSLRGMFGWKYLLRPLTTRMSAQRLYAILEAAVPRLIPVSQFFRQVAGRFGARLVPILEYSHLGLSKEANIEWAILDSWDMYSPRYDLPQSRSTISSWFEEVSFVDVVVADGPHGLVGRGRRP